MPSLRALIFGIRYSQPGAFRLDNEPIEARNIRDVLLQLSNKLGVEFVPCNEPGTVEAQTDTFRVYESGESRGLIGVFVARDGKRISMKHSLDYAVLENDLIVVSSLA